MHTSSWVSPTGKAHLDAHAAQVHQVALAGHVGAVFNPTPTQPSTRSNGVRCTPCDVHSVTPYRFQALLTLFSEFFASFPHGTFSLSVSHQYLALDEIYHHIRAPFPKNPTRREDITTAKHTERRTGISPSLSLCSKRFTPGASRTFLL